MSELPEMSTVSPNSEGDLIGPVTVAKPGPELLPQEQEGLSGIEQCQLKIPNVRTPRTKLQSHSDIYTDKKLPTEPKSQQPKPQEDLSLPSYKLGLCSPVSLSANNILQDSTQGL